MRVVIQRVLKADCIVNKEIVSSIEHGLMLLVGFTHTDKMNLSVKDAGGSILSISQFTLYANSKDGNRPSFVQAMNPKIAFELYEKFNQKIKSLGIPIYSGIFGADMKLDIICDGPVTIHLEY